MAAYVGNPDLKPETIQTLSGQISYGHRKGNAALTGYYSRQKDIIGGALVYENSGDIRYHGVEFEGRYNFTREWSVLSNASYMSNQNQAGNHDVTPSPNWMAKGGISYDSPEQGISGGIFSSYFGTPTANNELIAGAVEANPPANHYSILTANVNFNIGKLTKNSSLERMTFSLYGDNLLDEKAYFPNVTPQTFNTIPTHLGRGVYGKLSVEF